MDSKANSQQARFGQVQAIMGNFGQVWASWEKFGQGNKFKKWEKRQKE